MAVIVHIANSMIGEAFAGDGEEIAYIDLVIGAKGGAVETALMKSLCDAIVIALLVTIIFAGIAARSAQVSDGAAISTFVNSPPLIPAPNVPGISQENNGFIIDILLMGLALILYFAGLWKIFIKAGETGVASIIPIYNLYILLKIVRMPSWLLLLFLIPIVNIIFHIITLRRLAQRFHKGTGFFLGLVFLTFIFIPILGFGDAVYDNS